MLIPNPNAIQNEKNMILLMLLDVLKSDTDAAHPISKEELRRRIRQRYGFLPARNTLYTRLNSLELAGFPIIQDGDGVCYDEATLTDGELRFLIDSVLYSDFVTQGGAAEMIEVLIKLGSKEFQKYMKRMRHRAKASRKNTQQSVFLILEEIQTAIAQKKQIRCNILTYCYDLSTARVYDEPIVIDPYELVYKNGRYYLLGAAEHCETMTSWRVDRLCDLSITDMRRRDIPLLKEIEASGGMSAYVDAQPDLCGGRVETFKLQCARDAVNEIVDAFGRDFRPALEQAENYDDDTVILEVRATRESMKAWAITHSDCIVLISPEDMRREITDLLESAKKQYVYSHMPVLYHMEKAKSLEKAIQIAKMRAKQTIRYEGKDPENRESVDLRLLENLSELTEVFLFGCTLEHADSLARFPMLRRISLIRCDYPIAALRGCTELQNFATDLDTPEILEQICAWEHLNTLSLISNPIRDISFLTDCPSVTDFSLDDCPQVTDCSVLMQTNIQKLDIDNCARIKDFSFLERMPYLKEVFINSPFFELEDGIALHAKTGCEVHLLREYEYDADTLKQLGQ